MKITRARLTIGAGAVGVLALAAYALRSKPLVIDTATVERRSMESTIEADGRTRVRDRYVLFAPVTGALERLTVVEGTRVRAGDVVARVVPAPLDTEYVMQARARVDAADALALAAAGNVRAAQAAFEQRQRELSRANRLAEAGAIAPREVEAFRLAAVEAEEGLRGAEQRVAAAEAERRQARAAFAARDRGAVSATLVRAPVSGSVLQVPDRSERLVVAGTPLVAIGDPRSLEVVVDVLSTDAERIRQGDSVRFARAAANGNAGESAFAGRVRRVEPAGYTKVSALGVEEQRVNIIVDLGAERPQLGDGYRVEARIVLWSAPSVIVAPRSALLRTDGEPDAAATWSVFVVRNGRAELRDVRIGHLGGADAEVLSGLAAGDEVIVFPPEGLVHGTRVRIR